MNSNTVKLNGPAILEALKEAVERHRAETGALPHVHSVGAMRYCGSAFGFPVTWASIDNWLRKLFNGLTLDMFCEALSMTGRESVEGCGEFPTTFDETVKLLLASADAGHFQALSHGMRPKPEDAVISRTSQLLDDKWGVDIYTPDGWGRLYTVNSKQEANDISEVLERKYKIEWKGVVSLKKTGDASVGGPLRSVGPETSPAADKFWEDYTALGNGLTVPLIAVAPLIDAVMFLIREWDKLPAMTDADRRGWLEQLAVTYNAVAAGVGREPSLVEIAWSEDEQKGILIGLGWEIVSKHRKAASIRAMFQHHTDVLTDESGKYTRDDKYESCKVILDLHRPMLEAMKAKTEPTPTT